MVALAASATQPPPALADDPASTALVFGPVFYPRVAPTPALAHNLTALANLSARTGYPLRIAIVRAAVDLGSLRELFRPRQEPQAYATLLAHEISGSYSGPVLVVMPDGYGYSPGLRMVPIGGTTKLETVPDPIGRAIVAHLPPPAGASSDDLVRAATTALRRLSAGNGVNLPARAPAGVAGAPSPARTTGPSTSRRMVGAVMIGVAIALVGGGDRLPGVHPPAGTGARRPAAARRRAATVMT
ncbi:MAG TPA: hypothetical protein VMU66_05565 [Gaiellales bacterium]|nr:hypothetical protein [Gaiellales bacterium]